MNFLKSFLFNLFLVVISVSGYCQDNTIRFDHRYEVIDIRDKELFSSVQYIGYSPTETELAYLLHDSLRKISDVKLGYFNKRDKLKYVDDLLIKERGMFTSNFYTGKKVSYFEVLPDSKFRYDYKTYTSDYVFLSHLRFVDMYEVDTFMYRINLPATLNLKYDIVNHEIFTYLNVDTVFSDTLTRYYFTGIPVKGCLDKIKSAGDSEVVRTPLIRISVTPVEYCMKEHEYFNKWYLELCKGLSELNDESIKKIDLITHGKSSDDSILFYLFNYINSKVRYLDIEEGLGAYQPSDVNEVLNKLQGDCKDMSNLLCSSLVYKGLDARLAVASTSTHGCDFDFPSLSSGNHMICAVKKDTSWILLDPTERSPVAGFPPLSVQGKNVFITGKEGGIYYFVDPVHADSNVITIDLELFLEEDELSGNFNYDYKGYSGSFLKYLDIALSHDDLGDFLNDYLFSISDNLYHDKFRVFNGKNFASIYGVARVNPLNINFYDSTLYIILDFVPVPFTFPDESALKNDYILDYMAKIEARITISLEQEIDEFKFNDVNYSQKGFKFSASSESTENTITLSYTISYDGLMVPAENRSTVMELNKLIKKTFNNALIIR